MPLYAHESKYDVSNMTYLVGQLIPKVNKHNF